MTATTVSRRLDVCLVAAARPNFMKIAPMMRAFERCAAIDAWIVHTGQHYDADMSDVFFADLGIPEPAFHLGAGSGRHAAQTARVMTAFDEVCVERQPDLVVVVGDVNSTLAATLVAKKIGIPVAHVEAGLRSGDMTMPEEINRIVTDSIADLLFATEQSAVENLRREGRGDDDIHFVGHVMVDNLLHQVARLDALDRRSMQYDALRRALGEYAVVTLHRPANVDDPAALARIAGALARISQYLPIVFPVHPRTQAALAATGIRMPDAVRLLPPLSHIEFLNLWRGARAVLTDSGGLQEETTALGVPCLTLRDSTERPITVTHGTNRLVGTDPDDIVAECEALLGGDTPAGRRPPLWDGASAHRIARILCRRFSLPEAPSLDAAEEPQGLLS